MASRLLADAAVRQNRDKVTQAIPSRESGRPDGYLALLLFGLPSAAINLVPSCEHRRDYVWQVGSASNQSCSLQI
ncbi:hypothetical protein BH23GEM6_BH23GEM6_23390 [soil metagenome]